MDLHAYLTKIVSEMARSAYAGLNAASSRWNYGISLRNQVADKAHHMTKLCAENAMTVVKFNEEMAKLIASAK